MNRTELREQIKRRWPGNGRCHFAATGLTCEVTCDRAALPDLCGRLFLAWEFSFAGLMVEEGASEWQLRYCFYGDGEGGWVHVLVKALRSAELSSTLAKIVFALCGAGLALTAALAVTCFVKVFAMSFLGMCRLPQDQPVTEAKSAVLAPMAILAALCLTFGVLPTYVIPALG